MTTLAHRAPLGRQGGGVAARRALVRWAWRMFRREWRQQILVVTLLTVAVTAAIGSITIVHNTGPGDDAVFGMANTRLNFDASDPQELEAGLAAARRSFGTIDAIAHRSVAVPGGVETVDFRAQDPDGPYSGVLLALREGGYPKSRTEVAVTDGVAELLQVEIGSSLILDGQRWTVVGIVENPRKLSEEFALVSPSPAFAADRVSVLVDTSHEALDSLFGRRGGSDPPPAFGGASRRGNDFADAPPLAMVSVATVFLLLASLVAAAGFAVVAQRRLRQLGMLAATGATEKQLRLVLLANGAIVGAIASLVGVTVGLAAWVVFAPTLESAVDHRIDRLSLPWWLIAVTILLAIVGATAAAWWPGRAAARLPVMLALSGRPPKPRPARHAAIAAIALLAVGIACLALSDRDSELLIIAGIVATILGCLLLGPLAIRIFSGLAGRVPIAPRLALRDLVRYQARSGAALAAVTLALGIAATVVVVASAEAAEAASRPINLSDRQLRVYLGRPHAKEIIPAQAVKEIDRLSASAQQIANRLGDATVVPLGKVFQRGTRTFFDPEAGYKVLPTAELTTKSGRHYNSAVELFVATPAMLRYLGIDPSTIKPGTNFLAARGVGVEKLVIPSFTERRDFAVTHVQRIDLGERRNARYVAFITPNGLRRLGWTQIPGGWLIESKRPLKSDQIAEARELAADAGLTIEVQREDSSNARIMAIATGAGALLALAILALTVGLIRSESAGDLRTLTATGATARIRRTLTATTAGALALLGALLGVAGAYIVLSATFYDDLGYLSHVPALWLILAVVGVPVAAAGAGWLVAGREPPAIARTVIE